MMSIDIGLARTVIAVADAYAGRPLPSHLRSQLADIAEHPELPLGLRRAALHALRSAQ